MTSTVRLISGNRYQRHPSRAKKMGNRMTHEKPAMPDEIWVNRDPNSGNSFYGADGRLHQALKDCRTKYIRADLAHPQAEAVDVEAVKQEIAETFKSMDKVEILIVNLVIDHLAAKGMLKTDKSE